MGNLTLQEIILKNVVIHYIDTPEPIGSKQLQQTLEVDVSSATIRNYFKKLVEQGYLDQLHSSSGRIPTSMAFKEYWNAQIDLDNPLQVNSFETLEQGSKFFGVYSIFKKDSVNRLEGVYNIENKFLLLIFEKDEVVVSNNKLISAFLGQFEGYDVKDIYQVAKENSISELIYKLKDLVDGGVKNFNHKELISVANSNEEWSERNFASYFNGDIIDSNEDGIYFEHFAPKDHMVIKRDCIVENTRGSLLILGHMSRDFNHFYSSI